MQPTVKPGVFDGVADFFRGIGFVITTPRLWPYALVPSVIAILIAVPVACFGVAGAHQWVSHLITPEAGTWASAGGTVVKVVLSLVAVLVALLIGTTLAQPLSGWALDRIVRAQERALGSNTEWPEPPLLRQVGLSLAVSVSGLLVAMVCIGFLLIVQLLFPPAAIVCVPLKFFISGLLVAWDFADYPLSLREVSVTGRLRWMRKNARSVIGFGLAGALFLLVPCVGLFVLPMGAAGAARLVLRSPPE